ncbi:hypothetical protein KBB76_03395 [Candidatus Saccharibacteria bacterium]|jgi:deoxycytidine triphosphate deaminase|nr:hypothetical protein [Candidatus Saccharibacteria bacterium]HOR23214.1 hypothetical protein [Candidatus Saccharibacteria bacterium]
MFLRGAIDINQAIQEKAIAIYPYDANAINNMAYNITLGQYYFKTEKKIDSFVYNPLDSEEVESYFDGPYKAISHERWAKLNKVKLLSYLSPDLLVISIAPHERVLLHSHEFLAIDENYRVEIIPQSFWTSNGLIIDCLNPARESNDAVRIVFSVFNANRLNTILLPVGEAIANLMLYKDVLSSSNASKQPALVKDLLDTLLSKAKKEWSPDKMLPSPDKYINEGFFKESNEQKDI